MQYRSDWDNSGPHQHDGGAGGDGNDDGEHASETGLTGLPVRKEKSIIMLFYVPYLYF